MVAIPGTGVYPSTIDTSQIFLLTDYGSHYTMPRFYLPGTGNTGVFLSVEDYLDISSFITFTLSSSGAFGSAKNELIITFPNGGQTLYTNDTYDILWASYGESNESVDLYYSTGGDTNTYKPGYCVFTENWTLIEGGLDNSGSYSWNLSGSGLSETDSLRLKIVASNGESCDINGHYIKIRDPSRSNTFLFTKPSVSWDNK
jgi:Developmentally Regulated MAPK Interacting Protein.